MVIENSQHQTSSGAINFLCRAYKAASEPGSNSYAAMCISCGIGD